MMQETYVPGYGSSQARRRATLQRTRRFALVGMVVGALALFVATGVTFTNANSSITIAPASANVAPAVFSSALPTAAGTPLVPTRWVSANSTTKLNPSWTPTLNTVVSQSATLADIAIVDTRGFTGNVIITVAIGNAGNLNQAYSYIILPVELREWDGTAWGATLNETVGGATTARYISLTNGFLQYFMAGGKIYEVIIPQGGSIYTINTAPTAPGTLSPVFMVQVRAG